MQMSGQFHAPAALSPGKSPRYPLIRRLGGPQSRSGLCRERKHLLSLPGIGPWLSSPWPVTIPTELTRLLLLSEWETIDICLGFKVLTAVVMKGTIFWDRTLKVKLRFGGTYRLHLQAYSSTLKMEAICSSETSVDFQRTTRRYMPEDNIRQ
jgi:hypothetical protein